jgi:uncharacterized membrane protein
MNELTDPQQIQINIRDKKKIQWETLAGYLLVAGAVIFHALWNARPTTVYLNIPVSMDAPKFSVSPMVVPFTVTPEKKTAIDLSP